MPKLTINDNVHYKIKLIQDTHNLATQAQTLDYVLTAYINIVNNTEINTALQTQVLEEAEQTLDIAQTVKEEEANRLTTLYINKITPFAHLPAEEIASKIGIPLAKVKEYLAIITI